MLGSRSKIPAGIEVIYSQDQAEFAKFARQVIKDLGYGDQLGDDPDELDEEQEDQAEEDAEEQPDPDSTGQDDQDEQDADATPEQSQEEQQHHNRHRGFAIEQPF